MTRIERRNQQITQAGVGILFVLLLAVLFGGGGCIVTTDKQKAPQAMNKAADSMNKAADVLITVAGAINKAEPVAKELENATGKTLSEETATKTQTVAGKIQTYAEKGQTGAAIVASIPGAQQPYAAGAAAILGAIGTVAGAIGAFMENRKKRKAEDAAILAADVTPGGGATLQAVAKSTGTSGQIDAAYARNVKAGTVQLKKKGAA